MSLASHHSLLKNTQRVCVCLHVCVFVRVCERERKRNESSECFCKQIIPWCLISLKVLPIVVEGVASLEFVTSTAITSLCFVCREFQNGRGQQMFKGSLLWSKHPFDSK